MTKPPSPESLPTPDVRAFQARLKEILKIKNHAGDAWFNAKWGVYGFYDFDREPIYVGQTNENLRTRVRRHLTNQRSDAVAMRILDPFEVAEVAVWPIWEYQGKTLPKDSLERIAAQEHLDALEYTVYRRAIEESRFGAILNEKIPKVKPLIDLPPSLRESLMTEEVRAERSHHDIRIARRADTLSRLAAVARERGTVSPGLRRVIVVQSLRLAYLAGTRLAFAEGRDAPDPDVIHRAAPLLGDVTEEAVVSPAEE